jgi:hypothetical protein
MTIDRLKPFQVDTLNLNQADVKNLTTKLEGNISGLELHELFEYNIALFAYFLKRGYIEYDEIFFLSAGIIEDEDNRPSYLCCVPHRKQGLIFYAINIAGSDENVWESNLQFNPSAKRMLEGLNYAIKNLPQALVNTRLFDRTEIKPENIYGLLIMGSEKEFVRDRNKQDRKRKLNQTGNLRLRTYSSFLRHQKRENRQQWLENPIDAMLSLLNK